MVDKIIIGETDSEGNNNPYVISFVLKSGKNANGTITEEKESKVKKQKIKAINIEEKNVVGEIKSFQQLKIFEKDEDLFRNKKQLEYINVKVIADYEGDISSDIANQ